MWFIILLVIILGTLAAYWLDRHGYQRFEWVLVVLAGFAAYLLALAVTR